MLRYRQRAVLQSMSPGAHDKMPLMSRAGIQFRKWAILCHRWMGVVFCLLFAMWFVSGIVLMYWTYPGVGLQDRLARQAPLDASRIRLSPAEAYARLQTTEAPTRIQLSLYDGRPAYRFQFEDVPLLVYADTGEMQDEFSQALARRIAANWTGQPANRARFEGTITEPDQWTVSGEFRELRPFFKFSWPDGEEVYVSQVSGWVEQYTTRSSRLGAYFGAIPHWLYFTALRKKGSLWSKVVIWSSAAGTAVAIFGLVVGILLYSPVGKRYRFPRGRSSLPYAGQKRWHTMLGLVFGLVTCTWIFSGMLSMDPFDWQEERGNPRLGSTLRGGPLPLETFAEKDPRAALGAASASLRVKELDLTSFAGEPIYLARESAERSRIIPMHGAPAELLDAARVTRVLAEASRPYQLIEARVERQYEAYYLDRHHELPLPVLRVHLNDPPDSLYFVDLKTGRIVESYATASRWDRWLYHGLHSFDLPWLYKHRPAWDLVVWVLMLGGTGLSVTSVVIGWRRLQRKMASIF
jgi:hypothetical protein